MNKEEIDLILNGVEEEVIVKPEDIDVVFKNRDSTIPEIKSNSIFGTYVAITTGKSRQYKKRRDCFCVENSTIAYEFMAQLHYNLEQKELQNKQTRMQKLWQKVKQVTKNLKLKLMTLLRL